MTVELDHTLRATRFPVNLPVRYRAHGDNEWSYGMTVDISCSGVLFRSGRTVPPGTALELEVVLPGERESFSRVISRGSVMRAFVPRNDPRDRAMAVTTDVYVFVRSARNDPR